jgi:DEAD/DEAH box helicase domain-containing protein
VPLSVVCMTVPPKMELFNLCFSTDRRTRFVSCSATISNPKQHMKNIFGIDDIEEVTEDGAPSGIKDFLLWNPSAVDPVEPRLGRESPLSQATGLMRFLMKRGIRVILFCKVSFAFYSTNSFGNR